MPKFLIVGKFVSIGSLVLSLTVIVLSLVFDLLIYRQVDQMLGGNGVSSDTVLVIVFYFFYFSLIAVMVFSYLIIRKCDYKMRGLIFLLAGIVVVITGLSLFAFGFDSQRETIAISTVLFLGILSIVLSSTLAHTLPIDNSFYAGS